MNKLVSLTVAAAFMGAVTAHAAEIKPAIIYDLGGKFDKSFNEGVFNGAQKFQKDTGVAFRDFEIQNDTQREQALPANLARHWATMSTRASCVAAMKAEGFA